jgi:hypothetical protein
MANWRFCARPIGIAAASEPKLLDLGASSAERRPDRCPQCRSRAVPPDQNRRRHPGAGERSCDRTTVVQTRCAWEVVLRCFLEMVGRGADAATPIPLFDARSLDRVGRFLRRRTGRSEVSARRGAAGRDEGDPPGIGPCYQHRASFRCRRAGAHRGLYRYPPCKRNDGSDTQSRCRKVKCLCRHGGARRD